MADISLKPISELPVLQINSSTDTANTYLVVSVPDTFNPGNFVSRKSSVASLINTTNMDAVGSVQNRIDNAIADFGKSLSGTVQNALSDTLPGSSIVITNQSNKLSTSNIKLSELNCLSGCVANIKATFDLVQLSTTVLSTEFTNSFNTLTGTTIPTINAKLIDISSSYIPRVSTSLSQEIDAKSSTLSTKLNTLSIEVDIIKGKYLDKDENAAKLDQLSTEILAIVADVSSRLSTALTTISVEHSSRLNALTADVQTNANNIQFILNNLNIGIDMYETVLSNGAWVYNQILDKNNNNTVGYLFKMDDPEDNERNEAVLLIGVGTPVQYNGSLSVDAVSSVPGCDMQDVNVVLSDVNSIEVDVDPSTNETIIKIDGNEQSVQLQQFLFLNIN